VRFEGQLRCYLCPRHLVRTAVSMCRWRCVLWSVLGTQACRKDGRGEGGGGETPPKGGPGEIFLPGGARGRVGGPGRGGEGGPGGGGGWWGGWC